MKTTILIVFSVIICMSNVSAYHAKCQLVGAKPVKEDWITMHPTCIKAVRDQVKEEIRASITYLSMAAHFSQDNINRPGFAKFFFESASEERQHAMKLIDYLLMRGELVIHVKEANVTSSGLMDLIPPLHPYEFSGDGEAALKFALDLETNVTRSIVEVVATCEEVQSDEDKAPKTGKGKNAPKQSRKAAGGKQPVALLNDYHLVDYLTGEFLEEQYKGQRQLAGMRSTLARMMQTHGGLAEFLYDKELLFGTAA